MTIDEVINFEEEKIKNHDKIKQIKAVTLEECICAEYHQMIVEWLKELKKNRETNIALFNRVSDLTESLFRIKKEIEREAVYYEAEVNKDIAEGLYKSIEIIDHHMGGAANEG